MAEHCYQCTGSSSGATSGIASCPNHPTAIYSGLYKLLQENPSTKVWGISLLLCLLVSRPLPGPRIPGALITHRGSRSQPLAPVCPRAQPSVPAPDLPALKGVFNKPPWGFFLPGVDIFEVTPSRCPTDIVTIPQSPCRHSTSDQPHCSPLQQKYKSVSSRF